MRRVIPALVTMAVAWSQQAKPSFEVTTVKPNNNNDPGQLIRLAGDTPSMRHYTLRNMILFAYTIHDFQLTDGPNWIDSDYYDVQGKTTPDATIEQKRLMFQRLLADRFKLAIHRETKELPVFNLTVAKGGLKIGPLKPGNCPKPGDAPVPGNTVINYCGGVMFGRNVLDANGATMTEFATYLSRTVGHIVTDKTGASGQYHFLVTFTPDETATPQPGAPPVDGPSIYTALQEQLGLKLDSAKASVDVLVIDHAEKPSEN